MAVELLEFRRQKPDGKKLADLWFRVERSEGPTPSYDLIIDGWVIGKEGPVQTVEVGTEGRRLWELPLNVKRPDVKALHPDIPWSEDSGFNHHVSALKLKHDFRLEVGAVTEDGQRVGLGSMVGRRRALTPMPSQFEPILITSLGRTGSTWLMTVLERHPEIVVFRPFEYEPRVARYWAEVFGALSEPASYRQMLGAVKEYVPEWWAGNQRDLPPLAPEDPEIENWLAGHGVEALARTCRDRVDAFYEQAARLEGKQDPRYFAEKALPATFSEHIMPELYPSSKRVFLVRDFRDMVSSILAFDRKRGFSGFGRGDDVTDAEFVLGLKSDIDVLVKSWKRYSESASLLRYEDLILEPTAALGGLMSHLGIAGNEILVRRMLDEAAQNAADRGRDHSTSKDPSASIGRWKHDLDADLLSACEQAFGEALETFGYHEGLSEARATSP
jgi:sulfotransferase family protein